VQAARLGCMVEVLDFKVFFRDEYRGLVRALYLLTADQAEAEELAQETMARVYERWDRVSGMESPSGYAYRVAVNLLHRHGGVERPSSERLETRMYVSISPLPLTWMRPRRSQTNLPSIREKVDPLIWWTPAGPPTPSGWPC